MKIEGESVKSGSAKGKALVTTMPISFLGGVDPETGEIIESGHKLEGKSIESRILVFPHGKGSTVGSYVIYQLAYNGKAPAGMININTEPIVATGAIIADIPLIHRLEENPTEVIKTGDLVLIDGNTVNIE